jgi:hypothetical protein
MPEWLTMVIIFLAGGAVTLVAALLWLLDGIFKP